MLTRWQVKTARAALDWSQKDLAERAKVRESMLKNYERGALDPRASDLAAIEQALDDAGILFLEVDDVRPGGRGVRFKRGQEPADEVKRPPERVREPRRR